jgi:hypothetical protein
MSISPMCCDELQSVLLSFGLHDRSQLDHVAWDEVERALSPARCPRLRTLYLQFVPERFAVTENEMRERPPALASGGVVNVAVSNYRYHFWPGE